MGFRKTYGGAKSCPSFRRPPSVPFPSPPFVKFGNYRTSLAQPPRPGSGTRALALQSMQPVWPSYTRHRLRVASGMLPNLARFFGVSDVKPLAESRRIVCRSRRSLASPASWVPGFAPEYYPGDFLSRLRSCLDLIRGIQVGLLTALSPSR